MKVKLLQFIFVFLICFGFYNFAFGQEKPVALKIDEYSEKDGTNLDELTKKTIQFAKKLKKLPKSTKAFISFYNKVSEVKCFTDQETTTGKYEKYIRELLIKKFRIPEERLILDLSSYRPETEIEFWFLPKDASKPPSFGIIVDCFCPNIEIREVTPTLAKSSYQLFTIYSELYNTDTNISFDWKVSVGEIVEGKGTHVIKVRTEDVSAEEINIFVKVKGLSRTFYEFCLGEASLKTKILKN